jgi:hypothetical protein
MRLFEFLNEVNQQQDDDYPRPVEELKKLIAEREKEKALISYLAEQAQKITTEIKYDDTVRDIISRVSLLAEKIDFDDRGYKSEIESAMDDARQAMRDLESAVYGIDEPFKYLLRTVDNELTELEYELDEHKWKRESTEPSKLKLPKQRDPNWQTMQAKGTSGASGAHRDKKKEQKQGYEKHKNKSMAEGYGRYWCSTDKKWKTRKGPKQTRKS